MSRIALGVEYDGACFHGWQTQQPGVRTVQATLERALSKVADHPVQVQAAGRTDTGVHGAGQVVHFDTRAQRPMRGWVLGCNANLPCEVSINWAQAVDEGFHARFSARSRSYRYLILNRLTRSALWRDRAVWHHPPLDAARMQAAARHLIGRHDFSSYRAVACQAKNPVRTLTRLEVTRRGDLVALDVSADGFLHHMVRNLAGVLMAIGQGERATDWSREVLDHRDRTRGGVTAPPQGLYLMRVGYDAAFGIPEPPGLDFGGS